MYEYEYVDIDIDGPGEAETEMDTTCNYNRNLDVCVRGVIVCMSVVLELQYYARKKIYDKECASARERRNM